MWISACLAQWSRTKATQNQSKDKLRTKSKVSSTLMISLRSQAKLKKWNHHKYSQARKMWISACLAQWSRTKATQNQSKDKLRTKSKVSSTLMISLRSQASYKCNQARKMWISACLAQWSRTKATQNLSKDKLRTKSKVSSTLMISLRSQAKLNCNSIYQMSLKLILTFLPFEYKNNLLILI